MSKARPKAKVVSEAARALGRLGGLARKKALSAEERQAIARKAITTRWKGHEKPATPAPRKRDRPSSTKRTKPARA